MYVAKKKLCEVRGCRRPSAYHDERLGSHYCIKHEDVWHAETEAILDHTIRGTGSRLDANASRQAEGDELELADA